MHNMLNSGESLKVAATSLPFCRANCLGGRPYKIRPSRYLAPILSQVSAAPIHRRVVHIEE
eukprot:1014917-Pleurochrysis_carterae.AAC.1